MSWPLARSLASCTAPKRSSTSTTRRNSCQYALRKASSISRFWASCALHPVEALPGLLAAALRAPRAAVALDRGERALRAVALLALDQLGHRQARHLLGEPAGAVLPVARHVQRRRLPEDALHVAFLHLHGAAVGQQHLDEIAVPPPVHAHDEAEAGAALAPHQREAPGLRVRRGAPAPPAPPARHPRHLDLGAGLAVAADAREVAAGRDEALAVGHRHLEALHVGLERLDALHVLVLAERGLDDAPDRREVVAGREQERHRAVAQLELARDRLGRAVHHPLHVVEPVAHVEGHHALALGIDAAAARAPRHLGQLVVGEAAEAAVGALGQRLEHHALGRHVDAERHRLGGEHHLAEAPLEEQLDEALHGGQDARVVEPDPHAERLEDGLVERRLRDGRVVGDLLADRLVHLPLLLAREQRLALGQDRLHRPLAARAAEDEVDGGQPPAALQLVEHHGGIHHPARVPAPAVVVAALALLAEQAHLARGGPRRRCGSRPRGPRPGTAAAPAGADG